MISAEEIIKMKRNQSKGDSKSKIVAFEEYPFVTEDEVFASKEYEEMYEEVKDELVTKKVDQILESIEKISIADCLVYKVKNDIEFFAVKKYIEDNGMRLEDGWEVDLACDHTILVDNTVGNFIHVYSGKWLKEFKDNVQKLMDFI